VERIVQALEDMQELRAGPPRGQLRIKASAGFGRKVIAPLLQGFNAEYPDIALDLQLDDGPVDFMAGRIDVAFRNGRMEDSQVVAKQLIPMQMLACASPAYVAARGLPRGVDELQDHRCINYRLASGRVDDWEFKVAGQTRRLSPPPGLSFNCEELVLQAALDGRGIAQMAAYQVSEHLRSGRLVACLPQHGPDDRGHYLCYLSRQHLPTRIRVFIDYMTAKVRALDFDCLTNFSALRQGERPGGHQAGL
jgi:DNA-binding transcriptional LysR family regulator